MCIEVFRVNIDTPRLYSELELRTRWKSNKRCNSRSHARRKGRGRKRAYEGWVCLWLFKKSMRWGMGDGSPFSVAAGFALGVQQGSGKERNRV
jgi:hypothetical protein